MTLRYRKTFPNRDRKILRISADIYMARSTLLIPFRRAQYDLGHITVLSLSDATLCIVQSIGVLQRIGAQTRTWICFRYRCAHVALRGWHRHEPTPKHYSHLYHRSSPPLVTDLFRPVLVLDCSQITISPRLAGECGSLYLPQSR